MRVVLQRVTQGSVSVDDKQVAQIGPGLVILLGIGPADTHEIVSAMADKVAQLRIFEDAEGKMNLSIKDVARGSDRGLTIYAVCRYPKRSDAHHLQMQLNRSWLNPWCIILLNN